MSVSKDQGFVISKLEDRIAPSSGVIVVENVGNGSLADAANTSNAGNVSDALNGNAAFGGNAASAANNDLGNAIFNG